MEQRYGVAVKEFVLNERGVLGVRPLVKLLEFKLKCCDKNKVEKGIDISIRL